MPSKCRSQAGRRIKGAEGERQVLKMLQPVVIDVYAAFDLEVPLLQRNTLQAHTGGCDVHGLEWLALEVKRQETLAVPEWWRQTIKQAGPAQEPVLWYRRNNEAWRVVMRGYLAAGGDTLSAVVTIDVDSFLRWFRRRLTVELSK